MLVRNILAGKGAGVATVRPDQTVMQAVDVLAERRIGAVVVSSDGSRIEGILSERDIVRALARSGAGAVDLPVSDLMTRDVVTCSPEADLDQLSDMMTKGRFRHVPVVEQGVLAGIVSIGDVVARRLEALQYEAESLKSYIQNG